ncbi:type 2 lantibiotic [Carnobacterium maltaromaticum]|uniref:CrnA1 n=1 Tax=Carnobacterium maltaromaticum TaxID=2751 RepID=W0FC94_CARML|nr:lichenicidin A2 family type 2 lantibiotic [Carnobacterium maltaromaticum]AHF21238.1 CrnA1 [Carnobacterium maltaromaticum]KRN71784.1 hypothetical protein IV76_GL003301 [Carnobacterium maltaromaticum]KRN83900.1 hypothetical protein IV75_GL000602 [Carnobacterium maltaromaticum]MBC9809062.1 type 2 lantibiotic [Carnobacterium maltaromaticum]MDT1943650.1 lichenicidin A2 family type 2 lantibiotic [Carnobacterium maltaromaticum]
MSELSMEKVVGETFEDLSIAEMTMVQGSGDINGEFTTSPACVYSVMVVSKASSAKCAAGASAVSGAILSAIRC